ncbi:MAG: hypothetical protein KUG57_11080 [Ilumatobacteraceae bacterium]|nr:hypothetical protein [Ilumatobacteraceae bacterium]
MTSASSATVAESLNVHGDFSESDVERLIGHWSSLDSRLRSFDAGSVDLQLFIKDRDKKSQQVTLDAKIDGHTSLIAKSSSTDLDHALNEVRDEMVRQISDMKNRSEPRNNRHLRGTNRG